MLAEKSVPEKQIGEFVERLKQAAGPNLESVVLYGSAVGGDYDPDYSNINLMVFLKETSLAKSAGVGARRRRVGWEKASCAAC